MSKEEIANYFLTNNANMDLKTIIFTLAGAIFVSAIIYATYYYTSNKVAYNREFNISLILLLLISTSIMLMIGSNVVLSLGMVGALSIVRFRTAIKNSRDTVFIFWSICAGLCVGTKNFILAIIMTALISIIVILESLIKINRQKYLLIIRSKQKKEIDIIKILEKIKTVSKGYIIKNTSVNNDSQEIIIEIKTKKQIDPEKLLEIKKSQNIDSINLLIENDETI